MSAAANGSMIPHAGETPEPAPVVPSPQYARGFEGMATEPFPEAARKVLAEAVNPHDVEIKPDGIVFLPGVAYRRILTRAFGAGGWALAPRGPARVMGNVVVYPGALYCLGRFVAEAVGECFYREGNDNMSYASCVEGAKTDCLSRCCKDLGIATEMWDANWRTKWQRQYAEQYEGRRKNKRTQEWETVKLWRLKNRVSDPHDLMAGAGGVAPASTSAPSSSATTAAPSSNGPASAAATVAERPEDDVEPPTGEQGDPGLAATAEQKAAVIDQFKHKAWKAGFIKIWMAEVFGLQITDAKRAPEALSSVQADAAVTLLIAHGTPMYDRLLRRWRETGSLRDGDA